MVSVSQFFRWPPTGLGHRNELRDSRRYRRWRWLNQALRAASSLNPFDTPGVSSCVRRLLAGRQARYRCSWVGCLQWDQPQMEAEHYCGASSAM